MDADEMELVDSSEEPTVIFDPAKLTAQLSELLELYLARAKEALQEEQMSSKDAVSCAKQVSGMLEDTQSGKLAQVDTSTDWPRLEFAPAAFVGRGPVPRRLAFCRDNHGGPQVAALQDPPIQSLHDAVAAVCQYDPETAILEPWAQLLARMNKLTQRLSADIEAWKSSCEGHKEPGVEASASTPSNLADESASPAGDGGTGDGGTGDSGTGDGGTGDGGTGDPPVIPPNPEPPRPDGGARVPALQKKPASVQHLSAGAEAKAEPSSGHT